MISILTGVGRWPGLGFSFTSRWQHYQFCCTLKTHPLSYKVSIVEQGNKVCGFSVVPVRVGSYFTSAMAKRNLINAQNFVAKAKRFRKSLQMRSSIDR